MDAKLDENPTLQELVSQVDIKTKWQGLGVRLKLEEVDLEAIKHENLSTDDRVLKMYSLWLESQPRATRRQLLEALEAMKAHTLADNYKEWIATDQIQSTSVESPNSRQTRSSERSSAFSRTKQSKCCQCLYSPIASDLCHEEILS